MESEVKGAAYPVAKTILTAFFGGIGVGFILGAVLFEIAFKAGWL